MKGRKRSKKDWLRRRRRRLVVKGRVWLAVEREREFGCVEVEVFGGRDGMKGTGREARVD